jgi:holliday junction DNA helicase RuvA
MIARLTGIIVSKRPTEIVVDVHGVAFSASVPFSPSSAVGEKGTDVVLLTHLHVREDAIQLYGFATEDERDAFRLLLTVNGIGPRMALGVLSGITVADLKSHVAGGNTSALTAIPGIGKKIAERLVMELKEKIAKTTTPAAGTQGNEGQRSIRQEALSALLSLGFQKSAAEKAVRDALVEAPDAAASVEHLVRISLRHATRQ